MNDARQDPTTPSPRNAPPMTDRDRLARAASAAQRPDDHADRDMAAATVGGDMTESLARLAEEAAKALTALAEGARGAPAGRDLSEAKTVTSAETLDAARDVLHAPMFTNPDVAVYLRYKFDSQVVPLLRRDHGLLTREEVERRAREWVAAHRSFGYGVESLVAALLRRGAGGGK